MLTFDDGPGGAMTASLIDLLDAYDCKATFFLMGRNVAKDIESVDRLKRAGHDLGIHTYDHRNPWKTHPKDAVGDIDKGYEVLMPWVSSTAPYRPPQGRITWETLRALKKRGAPICWWTTDSGDTWPELPSSNRAANIVARQSGGVVLMHDFDRAPERAKFVIESTDALLRTAQEEGLRVITMSALLQA